MIDAIMSFLYFIVVYNVCLFAVILTNLLLFILGMYLVVRPVMETDQETRKYRLYIFFFYLKRKN